MRNAARPGRSIVVACCVATLAGISASASAQMPTYDPMAMPGQPMPGQGMPMQGAAMPGAATGFQQSQPGGNLKQLFAASVTTVLQGVTGELALSVAGKLGGAITNWFSKPKQGATGAMQPNPMAGPGYAGGMTQPANQAAPMNPMGVTMPAGAPAMMTAGMAQGAAPQMYAGLAYEVHVVSPDRTTQRIDPQTRTFATGERFVVFYRPTLPGRITILNVNPLGQEKQIDEVNVAAGELARLGPYEFRNTTGDELLRLILAPCLSPQMMATTRDIVRVDEETPMSGAMAAMPGGLPAAGMTGGMTGMDPTGGMNTMGGMTPPAAMGTPGDMNSMGGMSSTAMPSAGAPPAAMGSVPGLSSCGATGTRSLRPTTRDIAKVESEDGTLFALDAIQPAEVASGQISAREITIAFRHR
jgi:hypothetical protein